MASVPSDSRKGKRKKLDDDDGELEEGRARPPPPQLGTGSTDDRSSIAPSVDVDGAKRRSASPSVVESASEADWLITIAEDEAGGDTDNAFEAEGDDDVLHVSEIPDAHDLVSTEFGVDHDKDGDHDPVAGMDPPMNGDGNSVVSETVMPATSELHGNEDAVDAEAAVADIAQEPPEAVVPCDPAGQITPPPDVEHHTQTDAVAVSTDNPSSSPSELPALAASEGNALTAAVICVPEPEPEPEPAAASEKHSADPVGHSQVVGGGRSLQAEPTLLLVPKDQEEGPPTVSEDAATAVDSKIPTTPIVNGHSAEEPKETGLATPENEYTEESTVLSTSPLPPSLVPSNVGASDEVLPLLAKVDGKDTRAPSANRLSISYAGGNRRLVVDAEVITKLTVFRTEGRIEVIMNVDKDEHNGFKGIFMEGLSEVTKSYLPLRALPDQPEVDVTVPPFSKATLPCVMTMIIHLDRERPLSEPKWVKTGDVQEWLKSMFGRMFWVAGDAAEEGWEKKIEVKDPDPAPTIWTILDGWLTSSSVGQQNERHRFLKTHMSEFENVLEILLRLVRGGERSTPFTQSMQALSGSVSGPLLSVLSRSPSSYSAQQTPVSLAVLAMFRMSVEYAMKANVEKGQTEVEERVGDIIRCLPSPMIYKCMDGMFKEWRVDKKGGR